MKWFLRLFIILVILAAIAGYWTYQNIFSENVTVNESNALIQIPTSSSFDDVVKLLKEKNILKETSSFERVSGWMKYDKAEVPAGNYHLKNGWNNKTLISKLRSGDQEPIRLTLNNYRQINDMLGGVAKIIEPDSIELVNYLLNPKTLEEMGYDEQTILGLFIPNTYELWWNTSPEKFVERLKKENEKFWQAKDRTSKLEKIGLTKNEVYTLASIVEKETQANVEKPRIAGVYMNRLQRGMKLQADPTVVFANKKFDLRRVLNKHLEIDSPYNTYKYEGLPPGPIYMPGLASIDAVLNYETHKYLYFCAKTDNSGQHAFAKTLREHNRNAKNYWAYLRKNKIR